MRHFWFTDNNDNNVIPDHRGNLRGAITKAEKYIKENPECEIVYINEGEDIVECVWR